MTLLLQMVLFDSSEIGVHVGNCDSFPLSPAVFGVGIMPDEFFAKGTDSEFL